VAKPAIRLIVNADDYGYYPCVSQGILQAVNLGRVTATGILANGPNLEQQIAGLNELENLDLGVHLNLTSRHPLSPMMAKKLDQWEGMFPGVFAMTGEIMAGRMDLVTVCKEWRSQIETVIGLGLKPQFLNSHEHIHMLPKLFKLALQLGKDYQIPHVRFTRAEWMMPFNASALSRNSLMQAMGFFNVSGRASNTPIFIGLSQSGKLDLAYLAKRFAKIKPGFTYELMCHPGLYDPVDMTDSRLLVYHAWEQELALLTGDEFRALLDDFNICLINYRELS